MNFFTSDSHYHHFNICRGTSVWKDTESTRDFKYIEQMDTAIVDGINSKVKEDDTLYHLGDWAFGNPYNIQLFRNQIICKNIHFLIGNHDKHIRKNQGNVQSLFTSVQNYLEINIEKRKIVLFHYPIVSWNGKNRDSIHLFGHCVDDKTELLTSKGWRKYNEIQKDDLIYSYNPDTKKLEIGNIKNIFIYPNYSGIYYEVSTNKMSLCYTKNHNVVGYRHKKWVTGTPSETILKSTRLKIVRSGELENVSELSLSDDELRLYICLAADGNIANTNLGRLKVSKQRKVNYFEGILNRLNINYSKNVYANNMICINFTIPDSIFQYKIKGLDHRLLNLSCRRQAGVILEAYMNTDGNKYGASYMIYSSKKSEVDILQHLFSINGYTCTQASRVRHGFSKEVSYYLCITERQIISFSNYNRQVNTLRTSNKLFWCIETERGNFMCRREGKVYITGNCHGKYQGMGKMLDVGIDNAYKSLGRYEPFSYDEILKLVDK